MPCIVILCRKYVRRLAFFSQKRNYNVERDFVWFWNELKIQEPIEHGRIESVWLVQVRERALDMCVCAFNTNSCNLLLLSVIAVVYTITNTPNVTCARPGGVNTRRIPFYQLISWDLLEYVHFNREISFFPIDSAHFLTNLNTFSKQGSSITERK